MKKIVLFLLLGISVTAEAQLKNINQLITYSTYTYTQMEQMLGKKFWHNQETGKMDSINYTRWIPQVLTPANVGDCFMIFYKKKAAPLDYLVYQTINKDTFKKYMAEVKSSGFQFSNSENKPSKKTEFYVKGKYGLSIITGREKPTDSLMYIFGVKVLPANKIPAVAAPPKKKK